MATATVPLCRIRLCTTEPSQQQPTCQRGGPYVFVRQALGLDELPHRAVVDPQPALGELRHQSAQGELLTAAPVQQPVAPDPDKLLRPVTPILPAATLPVSR